MGCDVCGADVVEPDGLWLGLTYTDPDGDELDADLAFCSRAHASDWFAQQPPPGLAPSRRRSARQAAQGTAGGYVMWILMTVAVVVLVGLVGIGLATVVRGIVGG